jgi:phage gp16-like protein
MKGRRGNSRSERTPEQQRAMQIRLIQIGIKEIKMADDVYRSLIDRYSNGRCKSSTEMTEMERGNLLNHIIAAGFKIQRKPKSDDKPTATNNDPTWLMMLGLWAELHKLGDVRNPDTAALRGWIKSQTNIDDPAWLSSKQTTKVIEALKKWRDRVLQKQAAVQAMEAQNGN